MKGLRVSTVVKEANFEGVWDKLETKKMFRDTITHKIFETNSMEKVKFLFFKSLFASVNKF